MQTHMARLSTLPLADLALQGTLAEKLKAGRDAGLSFEDMAFGLRTDHNLVVTAATVRRWCIELGIFEPKANAS